MLDSMQLGTELLLALNKLPNIPRIVFTAKFNPKHTDVEWREVSVRIIFLFPPLILSSY